MLPRSTPRRTALAGGAAALLAALAIAAPAGAAEPSPAASGYASASDQVGFHFTNVAQDFHFRGTP